MKGKKTFYPENRLSYPDNDKHRVRIYGIPRTKPSENSSQEAKQNYNDWVKDIRETVHKRIDKGRLLPIGDNEACNLFVTFYIGENRERRDIDNLLKVLLDSLKKDGKQERFTKLILDDENFRGIRAEKETVKDGEGAGIKYVLTKTFIIDDVQEIKKKEKEDVHDDTLKHLWLETYRSYWNYPMQLITAREVIKNEIQSEKYTFIDNERGRLFLAEQGGKYAKLIPPGYDWKGMKGKRVSGCMVFMKEIEKGREEEDGPKEPYHWLTKW